jgi:hypothetical protein
MISCSSPIVSRDLMVPEWFLWLELDPDRLGEDISLLKPQNLCIYECKGWAHIIRHQTNFSAKSHLKCSNQSMGHLRLRSSSLDSICWQLDPTSLDFLLGMEVVQIHFPIGKAMFATSPSYQGIVTTSMWSKQKKISPTRTACQYIKKMKENQHSPARAITNRASRRLKYIIQKHIHTKQQYTPHWTNYN